MLLIYLCLYFMHRLFCEHHAFGSDFERGIGERRADTLGYDCAVLSTPAAASSDKNPRSMELFCAGRDAAAVWTTTCTF